MSKGNNLQKQAYNKLRENIYYKTCIINFTELNKIEDTLINSGIYLPNLLRNYISLEYYTKCVELNTWDKVISEMSKTRKQGREADVIEFVNWIDTHNEYSKLINEKNLLKIADEIEDLEKQYNELQKHL